MPVDKFDLESMSVDTLWALYEKISAILSTRIASEKIEIEKRLAILHRGQQAIDGPKGSHSEGKARRKYPAVLPKFQNPADPLETWSGRGKQPRWVIDATKSGRKIDDFRIGKVSKGRRVSRT